MAGRPGRGLGDPARLHRPGRLAAQALDRAREVVAAQSARGLTRWSSPAPECSRRTPPSPVWRGARRVGTGIVTSAIEHSSVLAAAETYGTHVSVAVDGLGRVDLDVDRRGRLRQVARPACRWPTTRSAPSNRTRRPRSVCRRPAVPLVLDATSALGRLDSARRRLVGADRCGRSVRRSGLGRLHGAPAGYPVAGALPVDDYQDGRWPGRPDVPAIVAAAVALETWLATGNGWPSPARAGGPAAAGSSNG